MAAVMMMKYCDTRIL